MREDPVVSTFIVMAHEQPEVLARSLAHLSDSPAIVHVDARVDDRPFRVATRSLDHVEFVRDADRVRVTWGAFTQCVATFALMEHALPLTGKGDHIVLLSGTCYPTRPVAHFTEFLRLAPHREHIRYLDPDAFPSHFEPQLDARHFRGIGPGRTRSARIQGWKQLAGAALTRITAGSMALQRPAGLRLAHGQTEWALTREAAELVLSLRNRELDEYFRYTFAPDEKYIHTLIANSVYGAATPAGGFEDRLCPHTHAMAPLHYIPPDWGRFLDDRDWPAIKSSPAFFTRKMGLTTSSSLLARVDRRITELSDGAPTSRM